MIAVHATCPCGHTTTVPDDGDMLSREIRCERCGLTKGQRRVKGWVQQVNPYDSAQEQLTT